MDATLTTLLTPPTSRPPKKRGRPVGSSSSRIPPELERRMGEANTAFILKDYARATTLLQSIIHTSPLSLPPYHTLALLYEDQGHSRQAFNVLRVISQLAPRDAENWRRMARLARRLGEVGEVEVAVGRAIALGGGGMDVELGWLRGWVEMERGQWKKAAATWQFVLCHEEDGARDTEVREKLVRCLREGGGGGGGDAQAMEVIEEYVRRRQAGAAAEAKVDEPAQREARRRAREEERRQRREGGYDPLTSDLLAGSESESEWEEEEGEEGAGGRGDEGGPSLSLITSLCELYVTHHLHEKTIALVNSLSPLLPASTARDLPLSLSTLYAISLLHTGQTQRAMYFINRLLDVDFASQPSLLPYLSLTADHYRITHHPQQALAAYRTLSAHPPHDTSPSVWLHTAACLKAVGTSEEEREEAVDLYRRVLQVEEGNAEARIGIAEMEREKEREGGGDEKAAGGEEAAESGGERPKRPRRRPTVAVAAEQAIPALLPPQSRAALASPVEEEDDIDLTHLLQTDAQLTDLVQRGEEAVAKRDWAALIALALPVITHTLGVASGSVREAKLAPGGVAAMPALEDAQGRASPPPPSLPSPPPSLPPPPHPPTPLF